MASTKSHRFRLNISESENKLNKKQPNQLFSTKSTYCTRPIYIIKKTTLKKPFTQNKKKRILNKNRFFLLFTIQMSHIQFQKIYLHAIVQWCRMCNCILSLATHTMQKIYIFSVWLSRRRLILCVRNSTWSSDIALTYIYMQIVQHIV